MNKDRWLKIERLIDQLLDVPEQDRQKIVNKECKDDQKLKSEVIDLLQSIEKADKFLDKFNESKNLILGAVDNSFNSASDHKYLNEIINNYRILEKIGTGGMGVVFLAERCDGFFDKKVAIKLMLRDHVVPEIKEQFKSEIQILANLKHPGIARLLDGGIFDGLPYLVMEHVDGIPIDQYCDENQLTISERIELFISVLQIVEYAHNNLVIHRDLKPDNIFIDRNGNVKILDFGIAKLEKENEDLPLTATDKHFYSPKYASPEQMLTKNVSVQSDIFSAGLLLQTLLTNQLPFNLENKSIEEIRNIKVAGVQESASQSFSLLPGSEQKEISIQRKTTPRGLKKILTPDLDDVLLKSHQSKQENRYTSAGDFLNDLNAWLNDYPISAKQNSAIYSISKFAKRNRKHLTITAVILVLLFTLGIHSFNQIKSERNIAVTEKSKAEEMSAFLIEVFEVTNPGVSSPDDISARDLLQHGLKQSENINNPEIRAGILTALGSAFTKISDYETADNILSEAIEINSSTVGENSIANADATFNRAINHSKNFMWHLALPDFKKAHNIYSSQYHNYHEKVLKSLSKLGLAMLNAGDLDSARTYIETAYDRMQKRRASISPELLDAMKDYAYFLGGINSYEESIDIYIAVIDGYKEISSTDDYRLVRPYNELGSIYREIENYPLAEEYFRKSLEISIHNYGEDHLLTQRIKMNLITPLFEMGKIDEVEFHFENNIELMQERFSEQHWRTGSAYGAYGVYLMKRGFYEKAESLFRTNLAIYQDAIGPEHIWTAYAEGAVSAASRFLNNHAVADSLYNKHLAVYKKRYPDFNHDHRNQIRRLRKMYLDAEDSYEEIIEDYTSLLQ
jgi:serine/threonine-protein kinase